MATRTLKTLSVLACCLTGFGVAAQAQAAPNTEIRMSKIVSYSDLNLHSQAGQKTLSLRIKAAVNSVCGERGSRDLKANALQQTCKAEAMRRAQTQTANVIVQYNGDRSVAANYRPIVGN